MKSLNQRGILLLAGLFLFQCIGTDIVDDLASSSFSVEIVTPDKTSLLIGETLTLSARHLTQENEVLPTEDFVWSSSEPSVAEVDQKGVVNSVAEGQTSITAKIGHTQSEPLLITVVMSVEQVASVVISSPAKLLMVSETYQLQAQVYNIAGGSLEGKPVLWKSSKPEVATVSEDGLVSAIASGSTQLTAAADGVESAPVNITVGVAAQRSGEFKGVANYNAEGTANMGLNSRGDLILSTSQDFSASVALGTFVYLSNSKEGGKTFSEGLEIADISDNPKGVKSFNITNINSSVGIDTYRYVIILCKPAQITFGLAELN